MAEKLTYYSSGKLLISSEYAVIDGASALALPTKLGQRMTVVDAEEPSLRWIAKDMDGKIWFENDFDTIDFNPIHQQDNVSKRLQQIFINVREHKQDFLGGSIGAVVETQLDFSKDWGLGTSSTLVNNIAQWAHVDPFDLQQKIFGGSGYDIACAQKHKPITYQLIDQQPTVVDVDFAPPFHEHLFFVYMNKKQNSRTSIRNHYHGITDQLVDTLNTLTTKFIEAKTIRDFQMLMLAHERIISKLIGIAPVQETEFSDYEGVVKSLGAWGGDFILACGPKKSKAYFAKKGYSVCFPYAELISPAI
jgi:mevalonate kinase